MARKCLLLINPLARSGQAAKQSAVEALQSNQFEIDAPELNSVEASHEAIRSTDAELIVLGGGDGTLSEAGPALLEAGKTLCVLPLGTANDLAGSLGIPKRLDEAADIIANGIPRSIDMGFVNNRPFFNAVTLGLGVDVVRAHQGPMKKKLGIFNYPRVILQSMRNRSYFSAELVSGTIRQRARLLHLGIANGRYHGGGLPAHSDATIDDGTLHLYGVRKATPMRYLRTLPSLLMGHEGGDDLLRMEGAEITVRTEKPVAVSADGEEVGTTPIHVRCQPGALTVMVPQTGIAGPRAG